MWSNKWVSVVDSESDPHLLPSTHLLSSFHISDHLHGVAALRDFFLDIDKLPSYQ